MAETSLNLESKKLDITQRIIVLYISNPKASMRNFLNTHYLYFGILDKPFQHCDDK